MAPNYSPPSDVVQIILNILANGCGFLPAPLVEIQSATCGTSNNNLIPPWSSQ